AGHDPADDRPDAADVLVALPVAEPGAAGLAVPAVALGAPAARPGAGAAADAVGAAPAAAALRVAVQVVAGRATAERGPVDLPPAGGDRPGRAGVGAGQRAAEFGVAVAAQRAAAAAAPVAVAHRRVRAARLEPEVEWCGDHRGTDDRRLSEEPPPVQPVREEVDGPFQHSAHLRRPPVRAGEWSCPELVRNVGRSSDTERARSSTTAPVVSMATASHVPTPTRNRYGTPNTGWSPSTEGRSGAPPATAAAV